MIHRHGGDDVMVDHPTTTLEELFLRIVQESELHPGRRKVAHDMGRPSVTPEGELAGTSQVETLTRAVVSAPTSHAFRRSIDDPLATRGSSFVAVVRPASTLSPMIRSALIDDATLHLMSALLRRGHCCGHRRIPPMRQCRGAAVQPITPEAIVDA